MKNYIEKNAITAEINRLIKSPMLYKSEDVETRIGVLEYLLTFIDSLQEEPVSEDLEKAAEQYAKDYLFTAAPTRSLTDHFKAGAKWQKEHLCKPADGDDLPKIDREVIALLDNGKVVFAHRPDPKGWDAVSIITEKREHYIPKTYGKGGWNIPDVKYWLDVEPPKEIEIKK